jgi:DNA-binding LytR/AlgR family response regulator
MYKLRTIVLEDEDDNRNWLVKKLNQYPELDLVGEAATLDESFHLIAQTNPDAAFMDIQLIGGDVFTLLTRLQESGIPIPYIVMTTGYPEYVMSALNDYRRFVVQYLVKPFVEDWQIKLRKSIDALIAAKLNDTVSIYERNPAEIQHAIFINNRGNLLRLDFDKIAYFEAAGGGETFVVTDTDTHQVDLTLNKFLELLPPERFLRISKNNVINSGRILRVNREDRTVDIEQGSKHKTLGVGDSYYTEMIKNLPVAKGRKSQ